MCFSEAQSYLNAAILTGLSFTLKSKEWKLIIAGMWLALKELLQALLYRYHNDKNISRILMIVSWVNISFQPFLVAIAASYFDPKSWKYWNLVAIIMFIYGAYFLTTIEAFDIQGDDSCIDATSDLCAGETGAYMGKYHIAYKINGELDPDSNVWKFAKISYFLPILLSKLWPMGILFLLLPSLLSYVYGYNTFDISKSQIRDGEWGAMWCFATIMYVAPVLMFRKQIFNYFNRK